jgi:ABC-2 type transport system permease protein
MNKTLLILRQEYLKRVKKKSFIILTLLVPFLFAGMFALIIFLSINNDKKERTIAVYDESALFLNQFGDEGLTKYKFIPKEDYEQLKNNLKNSSYYALLFIPQDIYTNNFAQLVSENQVPIDLNEQIARKLSNYIEKDKRQKIIDETGIPDLEKRLDNTRTYVKLSTLKVSETGETQKSSSAVAFIASYIMGFVIYFFVFMYGAMVMRSVMEEKKSRIIEVIISSVKPYELMAGKIIGTALVGLTQVAIWIVLGVVVLMGVQSFFSPGTAQRIMEGQQQMNPAMAQAAEPNKVLEVMEMIGNLNIPLILFVFVFYFLIGYLLYSSLLGAVGAAVDNDEDSQQMVFPVTLPLILSIMLLFPIARNPEGPVAFWFSIIPLTSPVAMMARIPYGIPTWELLLSMFLLVLTTIGAIAAAAKIYRIGLLMYGKKVNLKELIKWLRYKN